MGDDDKADTPRCSGCWGISCCCQKIRNSGWFIYINTASHSSLSSTFQFRDGEVNHTFHGRPYCFKFKYRDPWQWILDIVSDRTLREDIMWFPVQKFLRDGNRITRIYDELNTGDTWWTIQVCAYYLSYVFNLFLTKIISRIRYLFTEKFRIAFYRCIFGLIKAMYQKLWKCIRSFYAQDSFQVKFEMGLETGVVFY